MSIMALDSAKKVKIVAKFASVEPGFSHAL